MRRYPVAVTEFLEEGKPHALCVLGKDIVVWKPATSGSEWRAFEDACPHRLAPLSEGRVEEDGSLLCAYHAWRFDASGACTSMPHALESQEAELRASPRACAVALPTKEIDGLLWVWPDTSDDGRMACAAGLNPPALIEELHDPAYAGRVKRMHWNVRDLPYGWDFFMENVCDPAHVPVSHHGIVGNRYTDPRFFEMFLDGDVTDAGFAFDVSPGPSPGVTSRHEFRAPSLQKITNEFTRPQPPKMMSQGGKMILCLYATPSKPGWTRHVGCQILVENEDNTLPPGLGFFAFIRRPTSVSNFYESTCWVF